MSSRDEYANLANISYIENLYAQYLEDPQSVDVSWRHFFEGMAFGSTLPGAIEGAIESPDLRVFHLIEAYRIYGHKGGRFDVIDPNPVLPEEVEELKLETLNFNQGDLTKNFPTCGFLKEESAPLQTIIDALQKTYCGTVGVEYMGMQVPELEQFIQEKIEPFFHVSLSKEEKIGVLSALNHSEIMDSFIHIKYPGAKRFSLGGGETLIPIMHEIINEGANTRVEEIVLGMAHRGRLSVLGSVLGKEYSEIFREFESAYVPDTFQGSGDVKYHKGYNSDFKTKTGKTVHITLCFNPSHLEAVDPIVEGKTRAKQALRGGGKTEGIIPILIHGDASIAGQGVVYETLQLSKLGGYKTGGTIHIVINNQVGFTANPQETKSTRYCTDIAKAFGAPVFHVNAEDPEKCIAVARLAVQIRQRFACDLFIELNCYRKYGHNETDEPAFTNPSIYKLIKQKNTIRNIYRDQLIKEGSISPEAAEKMETDFKSSLETAIQSIGESVPAKEQVTGESLEKLETAVPLEQLRDLAKHFCNVPEGFSIHPKLQRHLNDREKMLEDPAAPHVD